VVAVAASSAAASPPQIRHRVGHCTHIQLRLSTMQKIGPAYGFLPYPYRTLIVCPLYRHITQLPCQWPWLQAVLKFQVSKFMNHKLNRNQICTRFYLPVHELYKNSCTISPPMVSMPNGTVTGPAIHCRICAIYGLW
jgi:hypothetical protein